MERLRKAAVKAGFLNGAAPLPYGLTPTQVLAAMNETYEFLYKLNAFLLKNHYPRLEDLILGNSLSGFVSEILVKNIDRHSATITRNLKVGGHPDLVPRGKYEGNQVLRGEGLEIKCSRRPGGWQGHNPEDAWLMIFRYAEPSPEPNPFKREPLAFVQVLCAFVEKKDWNFSGRVGESRRTITASLTASGVEKLRANPVYEDPAFRVRRVHG